MCASRSRFSACVLSCRRVCVALPIFLGTMGDGNVTQVVEEVTKAFGRGEPVLIVDAEGSCCLALAAELAAPERVAFLIRQSAGIVRAVLDHDQLEAFGFRPVGSASHRVCHYPSVELLGAGVSAKDRAATLRALCDVSNSPASFSTPGNTFLCKASKGGVLDHERCVEAAYDLCRLTNLPLVAALAEPMQEDGSLLAAADAASFARARGLPLLPTALLRAHRQKVSGVQCLPCGPGPSLETESKMWLEEVTGECLIRVFSTSDPKVEIVAICKGELRGGEAVPVRVHSECFTGDILGSQRCDCGQQLHKFLRVMNDRPAGCLLYIKGHEGRGIGLPNKIRAYKLQDQGVDTVDANVQLGLPVDSRTYQDSLAVVKQLGIKSIALYTNNPEKISALEAITTEVVAMASVACERNIKYLNTKKQRLNHRTVLETFKLPQPPVDMSETRIGVVYTTWNQYYVDELVKVADKRLKDANVRSVRLAVPGANELISGARALLRQAKVDAIIVVGVLIKGNSDIYDATCSAVMAGLTQLNASQDTPIVLGVLMCHDDEQASERSHGSENPAKAWAETALHMATLSSQILG